MYILGISAYYHDSAATIIKDDEIIFAAQEERFSRIKQDKNFPKESIKGCLKEANISLLDLDYIVFYDKPFIKFERLLETYLAEAPFGIKSFLISIPTWLKQKLFLKKTLLQNFEDLFSDINSKISQKQMNAFRKSTLKKIMFSEHHQSHASSAFYPSPFNESCIITIDGVGEWTTTSIAYGKNNKIEFLEELHFPHSIGLLYSAFTYYLGFKINSGEYKIMGLAPYGKPEFLDLIKEYLIDIKNDGSFRLNMNYFNFTRGLAMTNEKFHQLFGAKPRNPESKLTQREMNLAASIQKITEEIILKLAKHAKKITGSSNLCMAGGVALNCVSNGKILNENIFENIWIQPAAGDAGGSLGAAYALYYQELDQKRIVDISKDKMNGSFLGPKFSNQEIEAYLSRINAVYSYIHDENELVNIVSSELINNKIVGWHYGRMEFGPRALGSRSILGDPRNKNMQSNMNLKIKYRESFRPFAPSILKEKKSDWFEININSPYMLFTAQVKAEKCYPMKYSDEKLFGIQKLLIPRSEIPAVTHIDYSARLQTVDIETNPRYYKLISKFSEKTNCPCLVNTSFNIRGEPIVCTPEDSFRCFMHTEIDVLVINNFILYKDKQPVLEQDDYLTKYSLND